MSGQSLDRSLSPLSSSDILFDGYYSGDDDGDDELGFEQDITITRDVVSSMDPADGAERGIDLVIIESTTALEHGHLRNSSCSEEVQTRRKEIIKSIVQHGFPIGDHLDKKGLRFDPAGGLVPVIKSDEFKMKDASNRGIYWVSNYSGDKGKGGRSTNPAKRHESNEKYHGKDSFITVNYDRLKEEDTDKLDEYTKWIAQRDDVSLSEDDIMNGDLERMEKLGENGLDFFPRLHLNSLSTPLGESFGGGAGVSGNQSSIHLQHLESISQEQMMKNEFPIDEQSIQHEHLQSNLTSTLREGHNEAAEVTTRIKDVVNEHAPDGWTKQKLVVKFLSSWGPKLKHPESAATCLIHDAITMTPDSFGAGGICSNAFVDLCQDGDGKTSFNAKDFYDNNQRAAVRKVHRDTLKNNPGAVFLDVTNEAYRDVRNSDTEPRSLVEVAEGEEKYTPICRYLNALVLCRGSTNVDFRLAVLYDPLCDILQTNKEGYLPWHKIQFQFKKSLTGHVMQGLYLGLTSEGDGNFAPTTSIWNNLIFSCLYRIFVRCNYHTSLFTATLHGKIPLAKNFNVLDPRHNSLKASMHGPTRLQQKRGSSDTYVAGGDTNRDRFARETIANVLSQNNGSTLEDKIKGMILNVIRENAERESGEDKRAYSAQVKLWNHFNGTYLREDGKALYETIMQLIVEPRDIATAAQLAKKKEEFTTKNKAVSAGIAELLLKRKRSGDSN